MQFEKALKLVGLAEGGYSNNPLDLGGETICGIARNANPDWEGWGMIDLWKSRNAKGKDLEKIAKNDPKFMALVNALYRGKYWNAAQCPYLPELLKYPMFSCAVNCGYKVAIILLQRAAGVKDDGIFGRITRTTCNSLPPRQLCETFYTKWKDYYQAIVRNKPNQQVFLKGWLNRVDNVRKDNY
jgi:lysozyme family protein